MLASLMEVVRTTVACECVYVRAMVIKALIWMQSPIDSFDELESIIASELSDPAWPAALLNDVLLTLHARFKVTRLSLVNDISLLSTFSLFSKALLKGAVDIILESEYFSLTNNKD